MRLSFTVTGAPRSKKNHNVLVLRGKPRLLPSKAWTRWAADAVLELPELSPAVLIHFRESETIRVPVNCRAVFYCDAARQVDTVGLMQGLADILEKRGVVENDRLLASWDGTRVRIDRENPRTEVVLETVE